MADEWVEQAWVKGCTNSAGPMGLQGLRENPVATCADLSSEPLPVDVRCVPTTQRLVQADGGTPIALRGMAAGAGSAAASTPPAASPTLAAGGEGGVGVGSRAKREETYPGSGLRDKVFVKTLKGILDALRRNIVEISQRAEEQHEWSDEHLQACASNHTRIVQSIFSHMRAMEDNATTRAAL
jgi:hypothetical protein